jgi:hypothetical protein
MLAQFQERYPTASLLSQLLTIYQGKFVVQVSVQIEGVVRSTGLAAAETIELAEDRARTRAIALLSDRETTSSAPQKSDYIRPDVCTICTGLAASMGAFLLSAGTKGKRMSLPNSRIMIHQPLGGAQGQATDIEIQAKEILYHKRKLNEHLADHTGQPLEKIAEDTERDFFMSPSEAKDYGLIDQVINRHAAGSRPMAVVS